jgi:hypothetical protein
LPKSSALLVSDDAIASQAKTVCEIPPRASHSAPIEVDRDCGG